jgi:hypothetical protein
MGVLVHGDEVWKRDALAFELLGGELVEVQFALCFPQRVGLVFRPVVLGRGALDAGDLGVDLVRRGTGLGERYIAIGARSFMRFMTLGRIRTWWVILPQLRKSLVVSELGHRPPSHRTAVDFFETRTSEICSPQQHVARVGIILRCYVSKILIHVPFEGIGERVFLFGFVTLIINLNRPLGRQEFGPRIRPTFKHSLK